MRDFFRASIAKGQGRANPLFPVVKTPRWKRLLFASAVLIIPAGGGFFGVRALSQPQFLISDTVLSGTASLEQSVVQTEIDSALSERVGFFFTRANKFMFSSDQLADYLTTNLPIESVEIKVDGNTLYVAIQEDVVMMLFKTADNWLLTDLQGMVLRTLNADEIAQLDAPPTAESTLPFNKIPKVELAETVPTDLAGNLYPASRLAALAEVDRSLRALGLTPDRYHLEKRKDTWLSISTKEKPYVIYVDLESSIDDQLKILASILSQHQEIPDMSYMDLRFGNRVYMK